VEHPAEFVVMQFARPGGNLLPIAMLLFDRSADRLLVQGRDDFEGIADRDDVEVLRSFIAQLADESEQMSGAAMLQELEDKLSNNVRITERQPVSVDDVQWALADLYRQHVDPGRAGLSKAQTAG
jgi:hypothetical protein